MHRRGYLRRSCSAGANRPDRFVSYQNTGEFLGGQRAHAAQELALAYPLGMAGLAVGQHFADAHDGRKSRSQSGFGLLKDGFVGLAEELAAFGVADNCIAAPRLHQHARRDLPRVSAFLLPEHVLRGMPISVPFVASTATGIFVKGGATTMSQSFTPATSGRNAAKNARVSAWFLYIFQLPAITRRRFTVLICRLVPPRRATCARRDTPAKRRLRSKCVKSGSQLPIDARPPRNRLRQYWRLHRLSLP